MGVLKGLGEFGRLRFIDLLEDLTLASCVLELLLNLGYALLELAPCGLFILQIGSRFLSGRIAHPCLLLRAGKVTPESLNLSRPSTIMHIVAREPHLSIRELIQWNMEHSKHTSHFVEPLVNPGIVLIDQLQFPLQFGNFGGLSGHR